jgi:uncharacterized membrane protein YbhN (UPF0104 family)
VKPRGLGLAIRIAVAVGLTALILWQADPRRVWEAAREARLLPLAAAVALVLADRALMAWRWLVLLRPLAGARHLAAWPIMRIFFVSTFVGTFLPGVGADAVRAWGLAREQVPSAAAIASVLMDRVLGVLSVLLMAGVGLTLASDLLGDPSVLLALGLSSLVCIGTGLVIFTRAGSAGRALLARLPWERARRTGNSLVSAIQDYAPASLELLQVTGGSVAVQVLRIVQAYLLGRALGIDAGLAVYFAFVPLILLVILVPVSVSGLGTGQVAFVWLFGRVGVGTPEAFALSILFVGLGVVGNLPGALLYLRGGLSRPPADPVSA